MLSIAGLYAGKLVQAGCKVDFWVRKNSYELKRNGFQIESAPWGNFHYKVEKIFESIPKNLKEYDLILNCLKCLPDINLKKILGEKSL